MAESWNMNSRLGGIATHLLGKCYCFLHAAALFSWQDGGLVQLCRVPSLLLLRRCLSDHLTAPAGCQDCAVLHHAHLCAAPHLLRHTALVAQRVDGAAGEMLVLCVLF